MSAVDNPSFSTVSTFQAGSYRLSGQVYPMNPAYLMPFVCWGLFELFAFGDPVLLAICLVVIGGWYVQRRFRRKNAGHSDSGASLPNPLAALDAGATFVNSQGEPLDLLPTLEHPSLIATGSAGSGKTAFLRQVIRSFPGEVWSIHLAQQDSFREERNVLRSFPYPGEEVEGFVQDFQRRMTARLPLLLVIDDLEQHLHPQALNHLIETVLREGEFNGTFLAVATKGAQWISEIATAEDFLQVTLEGANLALGDAGEAAENRQKVLGGLLTSGASRTRFFFRPASLLSSEGGDDFGDWTLPSSDTFNLVRDGGGQDSRTGPEKPKWFRFPLLGLVADKAESAFRRVNAKNQISEAATEEVGSPHPVPDVATRMANLARTIDTDRGHPVTLHTQRTSPAVTYSSPR